MAAPGRSPSKARAWQMASAPSNPPRLPSWPVLVTKVRQAAHFPPSPQQPSQQAPLQQTEVAPVLPAQTVRSAIDTLWPVPESHVWQSGQGELQAHEPQSTGLPQLFLTVA